MTPTNHLTVGACRWRMRASGTPPAPALDTRTVESCAVAVETQFIERQGHMPTPLYEDGYSDEIADAAKAV